MGYYNIPTLPLSFDIESKEVLKQTAAAHRALAELKGIANTIPNENILINTLTLQEAKDSSEVENIVTTQDELYREESTPTEYIQSASTKEVLKYREAIQQGFAQIRGNHLLTNNVIKQIQQTLEGNKAGFRKVPGTALKNNSGNVVYMPPQDPQEIESLMAN
ncbi:MAG: Fic family protein, partial [Bacteroidales bacterium]|nr:Fic family protein [Bacteroidales bacterium]